MAVPLLLALVSVGVFFALARAALTTPLVQFRRMTLGMATTALVLTVVAPAAGVTLLGPVLLSRRFTLATVPATVHELLERYPSRLT